MEFNKQTKTPSRFLGQLFARTFEDGVKKWIGVCLCKVLAQGVDVQVVEQAVLLHVAQESALGSLDALAHKVQCDEEDHRCKNPRQNSGERGEDEKQNKRDDGGAKGAEAAVGVDALECLVLSSHKGSVGFVG